MKPLLKHPGSTLIMPVSAIILTCLVPSGQAANLLQNAGFETTPAFTASSWAMHTTASWSMARNNGLAYTGSWGLWMQGLYGNGGAPTEPGYISYAYQRIAAAPGSTFTADAWFSQFVQAPPGEGGDDVSGGSGLFGANGDVEDGWIEVQFQDASSNVLADYKSIILTPAYVANLAAIGATTTNMTATSTNIYLNWINVQVTNQYDPATIVPNTDPASNDAGIINTLGPGQYMVAPAGTKYVQYMVALFQHMYASGAPHWDDCSLNLVGGPSASVISDLSPDGTQFFNLAATNFTFKVTSAAQGGAPLPDNPTSGIKVVVNGVDKSGSLQFSGSLTNWDVTLPNLTSNTLYTISITVSNSAGLLSSSGASFDTFSPDNFIVPVEDYDYNSGQFIQNPIPASSPGANTYFGRAGVWGVDMSTYVANGGNIPAGSSTLIPNYPNRTDSNVAFQVASDIQLPLYAAQGDPSVYNVNISYNYAGNWFNYTRNPYPSGKYLVYARISGGQGHGQEYLNLLTSGYGTTAQTTTNLGVFDLANGTDWGHYYWIPLTDSYGNLRSVDIPSGRQTLQLLSAPIAGENVINFMFVPLPANGLPPVINNLNPNLSQANTFVTNANLSFWVSSTTSTLETNNIHTWLNGVDVSSSATFTGNDTAWNVGLPLPKNQILTLLITATDANGLSNQLASTFDTFSQGNLMIEAEDFDFNGGQFIDNPVPTGPNTGPEADSYFFYPSNDANNVSIFDVDLTTLTSNEGETFDYRPFDPCGTQVAGDFLRDKFVNAGVTNSDYNVGWWNPGTWLNYTRTFPVNNYHVYGRLAAGAPYTGLALSLVTSGQGTADQTTQLLGTFADATANGWQNWHWVPMLDTNGQLAVVALGGVETLKATAGTGANANYYMFVPAPQVVSLTASVSGPSIVLHFPTQSGSSYTVLYSSSLAGGGNWQPLGAAINGDGSVKTVPDALNGTQRFYKLLVQ